MGEPDTAAEWETNAPAWIEMSRAGADTYRDLVNTPAFLDALPDVAGMRTLDVGCGEGHNTRLLRDRGALVSAIDVSWNFIEAAHASDPSLRHAQADASALPFAAATFDVVTAFMSLMDVAVPAVALDEMARVVRPGGVVQFSITHPVNTTPKRRWIDDEHGVRTWCAIGDYFVEGPITSSWTFKMVPDEMRARHEPFVITAARRTVASWLNMVIDAGLTIERVVEPSASLEIAVARPEVADTLIVPFFLIIRARRPPFS